MADHCQDLVRASDKDRYLATLFAPDDTQPHLFALYAFDYEIRRVRDVVSEPQMGEIRLQWWRDSIEGMFGGAAQEHPVAAALAAVARHHLPKPPLLDLIDAHQFDLYADQMPAMADLEGYLGETSSAVMQMACLMLAPDGNSAEACGLLGVAHGAARILSRFQRHRNFLPAGEAIRTLIELVERRWEEGRAASKSLPVEALPALLPSAGTGRILRKAWREETSLSKKNLTIQQLALQLDIWRAARRKSL
jgi:15-cis-phytoene synthase